MATQQPAPQKPSLFKNISLAGTAAVLTVQIIHPIDVVKTRLQIQGEAGRQTKQYNGVTGVIRTIATEEGMASFYKGKCKGKFLFNVYRNRCCHHEGSILHIPKNWSL